MSHAYSAACETHGHILQTNCPEGCGNHGWTYVQCASWCPEYAPTPPAGSGTADPKARRW